MRRFNPLRRTLLPKRKPTSTPLPLKGQPSRNPKYRSQTLTRTARSRTWSSTTLQKTRTQTRAGSSMKTRKSTLRKDQTETHRRMRSTRRLIWRTRTRTCTTTRTKERRKRRPTWRKSSMGRRSRSISGTIKRRYSRRARTATQSSTYLQVSARRVSPLPPCITICHSPKKRRLCFWPTLSSWWNNRRMPSSAHCGVSSKTSLYARKSTRNMPEMKFFWTGRGRGFVARWCAYMERKMKNLDRQKRKRSKAPWCPRGSLCESSRTQLWLWSSLRCSWTACVEGSSSWQISLLSCLMSVTTAKATIHTLESWTSSTLTWRKSSKKALRA